MGNSLILWKVCMTRKYRGFRWGSFIFSFASQTVQILLYTRCLICNSAVHQLPQPGPIIFPIFLNISLVLAIFFFLTNVYSPNFFPLCSFFLLMFKWQRRKSTSLTSLPSVRREGGCWGYSLIVALYSTHLEPRRRFCLTLTLLLQHSSPYTQHCCTARTTTYIL